MYKVGLHGFVNLIDSMGTDATVVNAARVSFNKKIIPEFDESNNLKLREADIKLINYLAKHNHWTPFAHTCITLHIKAPIPIRTQFFKHKVGFVENEISRRYVDDIPTEFFQPDWSERPEASIKQGSGTKLDIEKANNAHYAYNLCLDHCQATYEQLLQLGIAPEQARFILPQATYTEWYWTGSLAAYARFVIQRQHSTAQKEIQEYAKVIRDICYSLFPVSMNALMANSL